MIVVESTILAIVLWSVTFILGFILWYLFSNSKVIKLQEGDLVEISYKEINWHRSNLVDTVYKINKNICIFTSKTFNKKHQMLYYHFYDISSKETLMIQISNRLMFPKNYLPYNENTIAYTNTNNGFLRLINLIKIEKSS